jgi:antitoxin (DNA-binding transcriptional repressor) of toxin-antitoxin stability system
MPIVQKRLWKVDRLNCATLTNPFGQAIFLHIMTIYVTISEAKTRFSKLCAAALSGEEVIVQDAGVPKLKLVPLEGAQDAARAAIAAKRKAAIGFAREKYAHLPPEAFDVPLSMADEHSTADANTQ